MSAQITVHVADTQRSVAQGTTAGELFEGDRSVLVARVDGELRDLAHVLVGGEHVEPVTAAEQDGLDVLRHIAEHYGNTPVAVITAYGSTENAVAALKDWTKSSA